MQENEGFTVLCVIFFILFVLSTEIIGTRQNRLNVAILKAPKCLFEHKYEKHLKSSIQSDERQQYIA